MTQAIKTQLTFEEYLSLDAEGWHDRGLPEGRCEYVDGEVVELPPESRPNLRIANYLFLLLVQAGIPFDLIYPHACEVVVLGKPRSRYPDLVILREDHLVLTRSRATITLKMPPPALIMEVVSPGDDNYNRDHEAKRAQYQQRGIPEYWLINPETKAIEVLELREGQYVEFGTFQGDTLIQSPSLKAPTFTAEQVFAVGR